MKKLLVLTGGGDCPGLNAVIRGIANSARSSGQWATWGSIEAFNGLTKDPIEIVKLTRKKIRGIHVKGGTILKTTNRGNPLEFPVKNKGGKWTTKNISKELIAKVKQLNFEALINIGGDGSQKISLELFKKGMPIIGVPKTIDNDLSATDLTFGFSTAVQIATDSLDKLVTTAESHHRTMIMEVMGRDAGWIALHTAIAGGAEICLIPEIPFNIDKILKKIKKRYNKGKGFVNIVIAEGAIPEGGKSIGKAARDKRDKHLKLGGVANYLRNKLEQKGCPAQIRTAVLGHVQRGGTPIAFDRILATAMGVKAFEMVQSSSFGNMVSFKNNELIEVPLSSAVSEYNHISLDNYLIKTARKLGISFGD